MSKRVTKDSSVVAETLALIEQTGRLIYGNDGWITPMMTDLGYDRVTWWRWSAGKSPATSVNEITPKLIDALRGAPSASTPRRR
jgi:hypothetical protein